MKTWTTSWTTSAALALLLAGGAAAQDTYDLRATYTAQEGDRYRLRNDAEQRMDMCVEMGGQVIQDEAGTALTELDYEEEVVALSEGEVVQAERLYHRISIDSEGGAPMFMGEEGLELENVEVLWVLKGGEGQYYNPDGSELTPDMQQKLQQVQFATSRDQFPVDEDQLLPEEPVAVGDEWEISLETARAVINLPPEDLDDDQFEARVGRLMEVLEIEGHEILRVQIELVANPETLAGGMQFNEGARMECTMDFWLPAGGALPHRLRLVQVMFVGEGKQENPGGPKGQAMHLEMDIRMVLVDERSSVGDDAWAISDAVEFTTMFDEDDTDDAGE